MSGDEIIARTQVALPNSRPAVKSTGFVVLQNETYVVQLNSSACAYDFDGDPITSYTLYSLPANGSLYIDGDELTHVGEGFCISASSELTYIQDDPYAYTIPNDETPCNVTNAYTSFNMSVSDGHGESILNVPIYFCLVNLHDAPIVFNVTIEPLFLGDKPMFSVDPIDPNVYPPTGRFSTGLVLEFISETEGSYGRLRLSTTGEFCNGADAEMEVEYAFFANYSGQDQFRFCYETYTNNATHFGLDTFTYVVKYEDQTSVNATIFANVGSPLEPCPLVPARTIGTLPGAMSVCESRGEESPELVSIYLQGRDHLSDSGAIAIREYVYYVATLPAHGVLYLADGDVPGDPVNTSTPIPSIVTGTEPSLYYIGDPFFFMQVGTSTYANYLGLGWDGCVMEEEQCRCPLAVAPGCPDSFSYYFVATSTVEYELVNQTSPVANYSLLVVNVLSPIPEPTYPESVNVTIPTGVPSTTVLYTYLDDPYVSIEDPDDNAYPIGVRIVTTKGTMFLNLTAQEALSPNYTFGDCVVRLGCNSIMTFYAYKDRVNELFRRFYLTSFPTTTFVETDRITIQFYKPEPVGMTDELLNEIDSNSLEPEVTVHILLYGNSTDTDSGGGSGLTSAQLALMIIMTIAFGLTTCFCCCAFICLENATVVCNMIRSCLACFRCTRLIRCCIPEFGKEVIELTFKDPYDERQELILRATVGQGRKDRPSANEKPLRKRKGVHSPYEPTAPETMYRDFREEEDRRLLDML